MRELIRTTLQSTGTVHGLTGFARASLYMLAHDTGRRASELVTLRPEDFHLDRIRPTVTLPAPSGSSSAVVLPLAPEVAMMLRGLLSGVPAEQLIWPLAPGDIEQMLSDDVKAAGISCGSVELGGASPSDS
jgi:integrase